MKSFAAAAVASEWWWSKNERIKVVHIKINSIENLSRTKLKHFALHTETYPIFLRASASEIILLAKFLTLYWEMRDN